MRTVLDLSNLKRLSEQRFGEPAITEIQGLDYLENLQIIKLFDLELVRVFLI